MMAPELCPNDLFDETRPSSSTPWRATFTSKINNYNIKRRHQLALEKHNSDVAGPTTATTNKLQPLATTLGLSTPLLASAVGLSAAVWISAFLAYNVVKRARAERLRQAQTERCAAGGYDAVAAASADVGDSAVVVNEGAGGSVGVAAVPDGERAVDGQVRGGGTGMGR